MAKVSVRYVEKQVVESVRNGVTLELTDKEALVVMALVGRASGNSGMSPLFTELRSIYGYRYNRIKTEAGNYNGVYVTVPNDIEADLEWLR